MPENSTSVSDISLRRFTYPVAQVDSASICASLFLTRILIPKTLISLASKRRCYATNPRVWNGDVFEIAILHLSNMSTFAFWHHDIRVYTQHNHMILYRLNMLLIERAYFYIRFHSFTSLSINHVTCTFWDQYCCACSCILLRSSLVRLFVPVPWNEEWEEREEGLWFHASRVLRSDGLKNGLGTITQKGLDILR